LVIRGCRHDCKPHTHRRIFLKSSLAAGLLCAASAAKLLAGQPPPEPGLMSVCYSLLAPGYAISLKGKYRPVDGQFIEVEGGGGTSTLDAPAERRSEEAQSASDWFNTITKNVFG
jgi:hypothetical protein